MKTTTLLKITALLGLLAWATTPVKAGNKYDLWTHASSATMHVGYAGPSTAPAKAALAVFTSSGSVVVQSTSAVAATKVFRVANNAGTDVLSVTQGGNTTGTFIGNLTGNASGTAGSLAANGTNCSAGNYPLGVDASGNAEGCTSVGVGDALLASTQTWSGANLFLSTASVGPQIETSTATTSSSGTTSNHRSVWGNGWTMVASTTVYNSSSARLYGMRINRRYRLEWDYRATVAGAPTFRFNGDATAGGHKYAASGYRSDGSAINTSGTSTECNYTGGGSAGAGEEVRGEFTFKIDSGDSTQVHGYGQHMHQDGSGLLVAVQLGCSADLGAIIESVEFNGGTNGMSGSFKLWEATTVPQ